MQSLLPLFLQIAIPLLAGIAVTAHLRQVTRVLLVDLCGTDDRANFWVRTTGILLTVAFLARLIWKRVPSPARPAVSSGETPCAS